MKTTGIFAPARLSSERLPRKQLLPIGDTCMFDICCNKLDAIAEMGIPAYVLISEKELVEIAKRYKNVKIVERDEETGKVDGPLNYIFKDILSYSEESHLMFLNPCLIFLSVETIVSAVNEFNMMSADYATSLKKFQNWILDSRMKPLCNIDYVRLSTKEIEPMYEFANAFHIFNRKNFIKDGMELKEGFRGMFIENSDECIDIDTLIDYEFAKWKYENQNNFL